MQRFIQAGLTSAFALSVTFGMLALGVAQTGGPGSALVQPALADDDHGDKDRGDNEHGNKPCINPAGHQRGWCKDHNDGQSGKNRRGGQSISGTVIGVNGNIARVRLDNGQVISVAENGQALTIGQHYTLNGCYNGNVFVLGCSTNGNFPGGANNQISGTILSVSGNSLTLVGLPPTTINISQALSSGNTNGPLVLGRHITAMGYYQNGTFYATSIQ